MTKLGGGGGGGGGLFEEGHRPEINRRVLEFPNPGGVALLQEGRGGEVGVGEGDEGVVVVG